MKCKTILLVILFAVLSNTIVFAGDIAALDTKSNGHPYYIMVNRRCNTVTIYTIGDDGKYSVPMKSMICSVGKEENQTPLGTFTTTDVKKRWCLMLDDSYGQYSTQFHGHYLFHSVCFNENKNNAMKQEAYNALGTAASLGCVRLQTADAKWIYDNCESGTLVTIYDDDNPGPLGKPDKEIEYISDEDHNGWDPTDPLPENPWNMSRYVYSTSTKVTINGDEIPSFLHKQPNQTLIFADDLASYGFDVSYDDEEKTVIVARNQHKTVTPIPMKSYLKDDSDTLLYKLVQNSDVKVLLKDGDKKHYCKTVYSTDKYTLIGINDLAYMYQFTSDETEKCADFVVPVNEAGPAVILNGEYLSGENSPIIKIDKAMVPTRFVAENFNADVSWDGKKREVTIQKGDTTILICVDSEIAYVNGEKVILDCPAFISDDKVYTPVRFVAETLGAEVLWDAENYQIIITGQDF